MLSDDATEGLEEFVAGSAVELSDDPYHGPAAIDSHAELKVGLKRGLTHGASDGTR